MLSPLTEEEYLQVHLATKRESYAHRRWPPDVVRAVAGTVLTPAGETAPSHAPRNAVRLLLAIFVRLNPTLR